jgi:hypothetical protein
MPGKIVSMKCRVKLPSEKDPRFKSWAKTVDFVDINHENGYAFEGEWLRRGHSHDLPLGTLVLLYDETGSRQKQVSHAEVHRVEEHGLAGPLLSSSGTDWVLQIRDDVAELLLQELPPPDLSDIETHLLALELLSRVDTTDMEYDFRRDTFGVKACDCGRVCIEAVSAEDLAAQKLKDVQRAAASVIRKQQARDAADLPSSSSDEF